MKKPAISYFMPRHQTLKFSYSFKASKYKVNLMNKKQSEPTHFGAFICDYMKKLNMMRKLPLHPNNEATQSAFSGSPAERHLYCVKVSL